MWVLHPRPVHSDRNVMFGFAGDGAGVATDATAVVDDETKIHGCVFCSIYGLVQFCESGHSVRPCMLKPSTKGERGFNSSVQQEG